MNLPADMIPLGLLQWRPHLDGFGCTVVMMIMAAWLYLVYRRLRRRVTPARARLLLAPKALLAVGLLIALFDPVSARERNERVRGKWLALVDTSSSMDVVDNRRQSRVARARDLVAAWKKALPDEVTLDALEFDTKLHPPGQVPARSEERGTDLGGCLLALTERADTPSYRGLVLLTDGGDERVERMPLPPVPLSIVGVGTDPATWNDVALLEAHSPATAEKDIDFEITGDIRASAGAGSPLVPFLAQTPVLLEHQTPNGWEKAAAQTVDLSSRRVQVKLAVKSPATGLQRYRLKVGPLAGELSPLNNAGLVAVDVQKKAMHVLYFTRELGQDFKGLRRELGQDPGLSFAALFRLAGERFTLQGDRLPNEVEFQAGLPPHEEILNTFEVIILGSFPAAEYRREQMQALVAYAEHGGAVVFLGGEQSFGRGGFADTPLAVLFPWRLSAREPEPAQGLFPVHVPPGASGHPILLGIEDLLVRSGALLESVNRVAELKAGATALLEARLGSRDVAVVALQPYGQGRILGLASNTLWKWATQSEDLRQAYGLFWRQAIRHLTGKTEGWNLLSLQWDQELYRPGERAAAGIRLVSAQPLAGLRFTATLSANGVRESVSVEPVVNPAGSYAAHLQFRERGEYGFRLVAFQNDRTLETYEKSFVVGPRVPEGSRLEVDDQFLRQLAERGGGKYLKESAAPSFVEDMNRLQTQRVKVAESSLVHDGPGFFIVCLTLLVTEWILRRRMSLF